MPKKGQHKFLLKSSHTSTVSFFYWKKHYSLKNKTSRDRQTTARQRAGREKRPHNNSHVDGYQPKYKPKGSLYQMI